MNSIEYKLKKYDKYCKGEIYSREYENKMKQDIKLKNRMLILDELLLETSEYFTTNKAQKKIIQYLLATLNNEFKHLHRQASEEAIILSFIFQQQKLLKPKVQLNDYSICKKYNLTESMFVLILCRINEYLMKERPLKIQETNLPHHDKLVSTGNY